MTHFELTGISQTIVGLRVLISNHIRVKQCDAITYPIWQTMDADMSYLNLS